MAELSTLKVSELNAELKRINENVLIAPEKIDFARAEDVIIELRTRKMPTPQYMVYLTETSDEGKAFRVEYVAARKKHPELPKLIGWRGQGEVAPKRQRGLSMAEYPDTSLMTMDARPCEVEHDE